MVKLYNASLESFAVMSESRYFKFEPRSYTECDDMYLKFLLEKVERWGVFQVKEGMVGTDGNFTEAGKQASFNALKAYIRGALATRIQNYISQKDMYTKMGVTLPTIPAERRAMKWDAEIRKILDIHAPLEEELSFLTEDDKLVLGIEDPNAKEKVANIHQDVFSREKLATAKEVEREIPVKKSKKIESFENLEV